ncbi:hypothetical protein [Helicobacter suis]|uniref:hypothetical protein n=1 Tax=Helicobacter suis TaxID=104628 RepID=UPI001F08349E|nr:hypothetical protein [Helicobacter suis]
MIKARYLFVWVFVCVSIVANPIAANLNKLEQLQIIPTQNDQKGVAVNLLFSKPLSQTPKISPMQVITLQNMDSFAPRLEHFSASVLTELAIYYQDNTLFIVPKSTTLFHVRAKLSQDKRYLRLEFVPLLSELTDVAQKSQEQTAPAPKTASLKDFEWDYLWKVGIVIGALLVLLWILKRKSTQKFLFPKVGLEPSVTFIKPLDATHKLVTIEVRNQLYLILLNSNQSLILDKITLDFPKKDPTLLKKEALMEETKQRIRESKLKSSYV